MEPDTLTRRVPDMAEKKKDKPQQFPSELGFVS